MNEMDNICRQTCNQVTENSKAEATFYPLWSVDSRGAGQLDEDPLRLGLENIF